MINRLSWDSDFFSLNVGEIEGEILQQEVEQCTAYDLLYVKLQEEKAIEIQGFEETFAETKVVFRKEIKSEIEEEKNDCIVSAFDIDVDINSIYNLAFESGKYSRFKLDSRLGIANFEALYKIWVDNSLNKKFADDVLIYFEGAEILGFVTYRVIETNATIGLIATNPNFQGKGIGTKLIKAVEKRLSNLGVKELWIPTQLQNKPACDFYLKLGYVIDEKLIIKHFWKK